MHHFVRLILVVGPLWPAAAFAQRSVETVVGAQSPAHLLVAALAGAALAAVAVWSWFNWQRTRIAAEAAEQWAMRLRGLLRTAPGGYLLLSRSGELTCSEIVRSWLGIAQAVTELEALRGNRASGIHEDDFRRFRHDLEATAAAGAPFSRILRSADGRRVLIAQGQPVSSDVAGEGGVVVWFSDATESRQAIETLEQERQRLELELTHAGALLEAAPIPIWSRDAAFNLRHVNAAYVRAVDAGSASAVVERSIELSAEPAARSSQAAVQRAIETGQAQAREESVVIAGQRRTMRLHEVPLGPGGIGGYAIDVTERDQARAELDRFREAQMDTMDMLSTPVVVFGPDKHLIFHNSAFERLFGLDPVWLAGKPHHGEVLDRLRETRRIPEPQNFAEWKRAALARYTSTLEPTEEMWHLAEDVSLRVVTQPHPFGGLQLLFEDLSERMELERSYNTLIKVQQATLNNLQEGVAVFGSNGQLQLSNSEFARFWQLDEAMLLARPQIEQVTRACLPRLESATDGESMRQMVLAVSSSRTPRTATLALKAGVQLRAVGVPLPDGAVLITYTDVTAHARVERALRDRAAAFEATDRLKTQFVANMSYELRVPLNIISGFSEMMARNLAGPLSDRQMSYAQDIFASARRLELLINDILDLATIDAGELSLNLSRVDLGVACREVGALIEDQAHRKGLSLSYDIDPAAGIVDADERRLKSVLFKLLGNAVKFTPSGGTVTLSATGDAQMTRVTITDTGVGIDAEEMAQVFERFRRGRNVHGGAGLGLSLVKTLIEQHGGTVQLDSQPERGTVATIVLPRHHVETALAPDAA